MKYLLIVTEELDQTVLLNVNARRDLLNASPHIERFMSYEYYHVDFIEVLFSAIDLYKVFGWHIITHKSIHNEMLWYFRMAKNWERN